MPCDPDALLTVAIDGTDEAHVTYVVTLSNVPSENVPVATNCCEPKSGIAAVAGVTSIL